MDTESDVGNETSLESDDIASDGGDGRIAVETAIFLTTSTMTRASFV